MDPVTPTDLIPLIKAAELLQCHPGTLNRWISTGKLPGYRRGGRWFLSKEDCLAMFHKWHHRPAAPSPHEAREQERRIEAARENLRRFGLKV